MAPAEIREAGSQTALAAARLTRNRQWRNSHNIHMELHELANRVDSKEKFLELVGALRADWEASRAEESAKPSSPYGPDARGWENSDLGRYLDAMACWLESADNYYRNTGQTMDTSKPSWRLFADMLMAAKVYE